MADDEEIPSEVYDILNGIISKVETKDDNVRVTRNRNKLPDRYIPEDFKTTQTRRSTTRSSRKTSRQPYPYSKQKPRTNVTEHQSTKIWEKLEKEIKAYFISKLKPILKKDTPTIGDLTKDTILEIRQEYPEKTEPIIFDIRFIYLNPINYIGAQARQNIENNFVKVFPLLSGATCDIQCKLYLQYLSALPHEQVPLIIGESHIQSILNNAECKQRPKCQEFLEYASQFWPSIRSQLPTASGIKPKKKKPKKKPKKKQTRAHPKKKRGGSARTQRT